MKKFIGNLLPLLSLFAIAQVQAADRPNIILIMSDDMGYSDIGCYGGEIETPHLDSLAANGLRYTQFYNTSRCCPTRGSLLTGLYSHQAGIGHMMEDRGGEAFAGDLSKHSLTIAQVLKTAGYATYMSGKWHVTPLLPSPRNPSRHNWPLQRGFDKFFGTIHGAGSFFDPNSLTRGNEYVVPGDGFYYTDAINDTAVEYIENHNSEAPYFIYVSHVAAHWPLHAKPEDIAKYKGRYDEGWDVMREQRFARMKKLGLIDPRWEMSDRHPDIPWEEAEDKAFHARCMEVYAAQVDSMDQGIGRIIEALKKKDQFETTLIFYLQDNGACAEAFGLGKPDEEPRGEVDLRPMGKNEFQYNMVPKYARDGRPVRSAFGVMPGDADTYIGYAQNWANASNTPYRLYKHWSHEGGIASPLIAHWPKGIGGKGTLKHDMSHLIDIMATCVDLAGAMYPKDYDGNNIHPMEGISLAPSFKDQALERDTLFWEHEGNRAVRVGKMKLVSKDYPFARELDIFPELPLNQWALYNMETDRPENHDLSDQYPGLVYEMSEKWNAWAKRVGAIPRPLVMTRRNQP